MQRKESGAAARKCNAGPNPVPSKASMCAAYAFQEMRPNERAQGGSIQTYINAPFVDAAAIPPAMAEPHREAHFPFLYTHTHATKLGSLYLHIQ